jgi:hypothetical protein
MYKITGMKWLFIIQVAVFLLIVETVLPQTLHSPVAAGYMQFGAYNKKFADALSFCSNQAALAEIKEACAGVYSTEGFLLKELTRSTLAVAVPLKNAGFGMQFTHFGFSSYSESQMGLAFAKSLGGFADIGVQFNYYLLRMTGYGNATAINAEIGALFHLSDRIVFGVHAYNPIGTAIGRSALEKLSRIYKAGAGFEVSDQVLIGAEMIKEEKRPLNVNAGIHYIFSGQFFALLGIATASISPFAAAGLCWQGIRVDITVSYHPLLGLSPGLLLNYNFK